MKFLFDFFPILLFFIIYKTYDIYAATLVMMIASAVQVGAFWIRHRRFENMHLVTLVLVLLLGGATLLLHDERFVMWKPTVVNWLFAGGFLLSAFIGERTLIERMMGSAIELPKPVWGRLNGAWTLFFIAMGALNLYVAFYYRLDLDAATRRDIWVDFKLFGMMGLTMAFIVAQAFYLARHMPDEEEPAEGNEQKEHP